MHGRKYRIRRVAFCGVTLANNGGGCNVRRWIKKFLILCKSNNRILFIELVPPSFKCLSEIHAMQLTQIAF